MEKDYLKKYKHAPAHLFMESHPYFITAGTYLKQHFFINDQEKELLFEVIQQILLKCSVQLTAWAILSNHYHLVIGLKDPFLLPEIIRKIHSKSSVELNKKEHQTKRKIWQNYWDRCIRDEKDYYCKLNYVHFNPVKHGYTEDPSEYRFS
ncbi:MAG TPA: transposase, partial [Terriglobales bacterium]|nr:transposase [Terriglobales bacterium]